MIPKTILVPKTSKSESTQDDRDQFANKTEAWRCMNPEHDVVEFDTNDVDKFLKCNYGSRVLNVYSRFLDESLRNNMFTYCFLYIHGGVYVDVDVVKCATPLPNIMRSGHLRLVAAFDTVSEKLFHGFLACEKQCPVMKDVIDHICNCVENERHLYYISALSGRTALGYFVNKYIRKIPQSRRKEYVAVETKPTTKNLTIFGKTFATHREKQQDDITKFSSPLYEPEDCWWLSKNEYCEGIAIVEHDDTVSPGSWS